MGQLWQMRREIFALTANIQNSISSQAAIALAKDGQWKKALKICQQDIQNSYNKASALISILGFINCILSTPYLNNHKL